jgi:Domain of unknown function (DUF3883)
MIDNLNDVNRVLLALETLEAKKLRTPRHLLLRYLASEVIYGQNPPFEPILEFAKTLAVVSERLNALGLTDLGRELLAQNGDKTYELRPTQCALLLRKCYLDGPFRSLTRAVVGKFVINPTTRRLTWSSIDSEPLGEAEWIGNHFVQLGVVERDGPVLVAAPTYNDVLVRFSEEADFTEAQFRRVLKDHKLVGNIAESFVVQWEKSRLKRAGHTVEATCVARISRVRVNAGYDINSYDGASPLLTPDRFIEVKGSGKTTVRFVWTPWEMQKASALGSRYWIYFVGGIERRKRLVNREPVMIRNPRQTLTAGRGFKVEPKGEMLVLANKSGRQLTQPVKVAL